MTGAGDFVSDAEHLDWAPLEQAMKAAPSRGHDITVGDFMWMGAIDLADGRRLHLYKHAVTRRYLRLDTHGHAYTHGDDGYRIHGSPADAIAALGLAGPVNDPGPTNCL